MPVYHTIKILGLIQGNGFRSPFYEEMYVESSSEQAFLDQVDQKLAERIWMIALTAPKIGMPIFFTKIEEMARPAQTISDFDEMGEDEPIQLNVDPSQQKRLHDLLQILEKKKSR